MSFIKTYHDEPYPAISPLRPELSQKGQTVLVTGGAQGIGFSLSKAFAQAGAATIIIVSRSPQTIESGIKKIKQEVPGYTGNLVAKTCDVGDPASTKQLWESLNKEGLLVDVLVLNAAASGTMGPLVDTDLDVIWREFNLNVRGNIDFVQRFVAQIRAKPNGHKKVSHSFAVEHALM